MPARKSHNDERVRRKEWIDSRPSFPDRKSDAAFAAARPITPATPSNARWHHCKHAMITETVDTRHVSARVDHSNLSWGAVSYAGGLQSPDFRSIQVYVGLICGGLFCVDTFWDHSCFVIFMRPYDFSALTTQIQRLMLISDWNGVGYIQRSLRQKAFIVLKKSSCWCFI